MSHFHWHGRDWLIFDSGWLGGTPPERTLASVLTRKSPTRTSFGSVAVPMDHFDRFITSYNEDAESIHLDQGMVHQSETAQTGFRGLTIAAHQRAFRNPQWPSDPPGGGSFHSGVLGTQRRDLGSQRNHTSL